MQADKTTHISSRDHLDRDALFIAVQNFHVGVAEELLLRGADPNKTSAHGHHFAITPLSVAVYHARPKLVDVLLKYGALPDGPPGARIGPLQQTPAMLAAFLGDFDILRRLVHAGASVASVRSYPSLEGEHPHDGAKSANHGLNQSNAHGVGIVPQSSTHSKPTHPTADEQLQQLEDKAASGDK